MIKSTNSKHVYFYDQADIDGMAEAKHCNVTTPGWYFWDETEAYAHGPSANETEALTALERYAAELNGALPEQQRNIQSRAIVVDWLREHHPIIDRAPPDADIDILVQRLAAVRPPG